MRKHDLFGKKIRKTNIFVLILVILIIELAAYLLIVNFQQNKINQLIALQTDLTLSIDEALSNNDPLEYLQISEMIQALPTEVNEFELTEELQFLKYYTGLSDEALFEVDYSFDVNSPLDHQLASTIRYVSISLTMEVDQSDLALEFYQNLIDQDRLYYVSSFITTLYTDGSARVEMTIYTFYNDIEV